MKKKNILALIIAAVTLFGSSTTALAAPEAVPGTDLIFDAEYYAANNPDVVAILGTDANALLQHYISFGASEGRLPYAPSLDTNENMSILPTETTFTPVPMDQLANLKSLQKSASNDELAQAYNIALQMVTPYANLSQEEQLLGIATSIRQYFDINNMAYSTSSAHYNDPYGYFVLGSASCAGCTRATGLCLNILGIPYEHVNENQWAHQWCRVNVNGTYWICDAYGLYCGPEPAPYQHPMSAYF